MFIKCHKFFPIKYVDIVVSDRMVVKIYRDNHLTHVSYFKYSHLFDNFVVKELYLKDFGSNQYLEVYI